MDPICTRKTQHVECLELFGVRVKISLIINDQEQIYFLMKLRYVQCIATNNLMSLALIVSSFIFDVSYFILTLLIIKNSSTLNPLFLTFIVGLFADHNITTLFIFCSLYFLHAPSAIFFGCFDFRGSRRCFLFEAFLFL